MTVSYINLIRAQRRRHDLPVKGFRSYASTSEMLAAHKEARQRLEAGIRPVVAEEAEPTAPVVAAPQPVEEPIHQSRSRVAYGCPINMIRTASWRFLLELAVLRYGVSQRDLLGPTRQRSIVEARNYAIGLIYQHTQQSMPGVGNRFGRDHTTILHALRRVGATEKLVDLLPPIRGERRPKPPGISRRTERAQEVRRIIREGYEAGLSGPAISERAGVTPKSVRAIACQLGLVHPKNSQKLLPPGKEADFRVLMRVGEYSAAEALRILGGTK